MEQKESLNYIWTRFFLIFLGVWLIASPMTFGYTGEALCANDIICGLLLIFFGWNARHANRNWAPWLASAVGLWLQFAPVAFWTHSPAAYLNETITGVLSILLSIIIPGFPGHTERSGPEIPPGWSYNPSSWPQRIPVIALACFGWLAARYLAAYQLGFITTMWDPFFNYGNGLNGTICVIESPLSKSFPVSDAGMGALAYTLEAILGCKGGPARWRTMPGIVIGFGLLVIPLGLISIILIILQPLAVASWCSLCLMIAFAMLIMVMLTIDEVAAALQCIRQGRRRGIAWLPLLWEGLPESAFEPDTRTPPLTASFYKLLAAAFWGCTFRWNLILTAILGALAMMLPSFIHVPQWLADCDYVLGALSIILSLVSMADVTRIARFGLALFGLVLLVCSFAQVTHPAIFFPHFILGGGWIVLCWPAGTIKERYGQ